MGERNENFEIECMINSLNFVLKISYNVRFGNKYRLN